MKTRLGTGRSPVRSRWRDSVSPRCSSIISIDDSEFIGCKGSGRGHPLTQDAFDRGRTHPASRKGHIRPSTSRLRRIQGTQSPQPFPRVLVGHQRCLPAAPSPTDPYAHVRISFDVANRSPRCCHARQGSKSVFVEPVTDGIAPRSPTLPPCRLQQKPPRHVSGDSTNDRVDPHSAPRHSSAAAYPICYADP